MLAVPAWKPGFPRFVCLVTAVAKKYYMNVVSAEEKKTNLQVQPPRWHAVYTRSRFEKRLMGLLAAKGIEAYVPMRKALHQWSDRKRIVEEPVIRSYCFVKVDAADYHDVLNTPGAVRYVWFSGRPATIPDRQIEILKAITGSDVEMECLPDTFRPGLKVCVNAGPLTGLEGELISVSSKHRVIVRIDHLRQVITLSISPKLIQVAK